MGISGRLGWIGVDVGTHAVKIAQTARDGAEVRLHRAAVIQRASAWSGDDALALEQPLPSMWEIRAALECGGFSGRDAICSLPMNACQLRGLNVPPGSDWERRTIIGDELAEEWADLRQAMEFDFWELDGVRAEKSSDGFNVNVLATSRLWVGQIWRDCRKCGLDCWAIDGTPLSMARAVGLVGGTNGRGSTLAVDWGYSNTTLCVVADGRPLYTRRVQSCAFGLVLDAITGALNINIDEAQHLADSQGLMVADVKDAALQPPVIEDATAETMEKGIVRQSDRKTQAAITEAATDPLDDLVTQIGRTLQFMEAQRRHLQPTAIWLMGGGASMRNAASYLEAELGTPVHVWKLPPADEPIPCAADCRSAVFASAASLSALAWSAA